MSKPNYYQKLKQENEELKKRIDTNIVSFQADNIPSFLFTNTVTNDELYAYLKKNPTASKFLFNKYKTNRDFIKELCDPSNPIYLEMVAENLKEIFTISEATEDIESLKKEQFDLQQNLNDLKQTLEQNTRAYDSLDSQISNGKQELDNIQKQISNLREEESLKRIKSFYKSVDDFIMNITEAHDKLPIESIGSLRLDIHQINLLKLAICFSMLFNSCFPFEICESRESYSLVFCSSVFFRSIKFCCRSNCSFFNESISSSTSDILYISFRFSATISRYIGFDGSHNSLMKSLLFLYLLKINLEAVGFFLRYV